MFSSIQALLLKGIAMAEYDKNYESWEKREEERAIELERHLTLFFTLCPSCPVLLHGLVSGEDKSQFLKNHFQYIISYYE